MTINDVYKSKSYQIYKTKSRFNLLFPKALRILLYFIGFISLLVVVNQYSFLWKITQTWTGFACLILAIILALLFIDIFINFGLKNTSKVPLDQIKNTPSILDYFCDETNEVLDKAIDLTKKYKLSDLQLSTFVFALRYTSQGRYFLNRAQIILSDQLERDGMTSLAKQKIPEEIQETRSNKFLLDSQRFALSKKKTEIGIYQLILALYDNNQFFSHFAYELGLKREDVLKIINWTERLFTEFRPQYWWQKNYYGGGIGKDWASGYTPALNLYSRDVSEYLLDARLEYQSMGHRQIMKTMEDILAKSGKNNVLLIGDPGIGKKTIVNAFAQKLARGQSYQTLHYKHVIQLDTVKLLAGVSRRGDIEARFSRIFNEVIKAGNIILFIDNIASLVGGNNEEVGAINATEFLIPYLESGSVQIIATTSWEDFKNRVQTSSGLENLFDKVEVHEPKKDEVLPIIEDALLFTENKHKVMFTYQTVRELVEVSDRYIHDRPFPEKAIDLLGELGIRAEKDGQTVITPKMVNDLVSEKVKVPVGEAAKSEKDKLLHLEEYLHKRVIGQEEAISAISNALRRARAGLSSQKRPIGTFLFIGPTGVGKTETCKALAEAYYGSEKNMIRFDMSEFQEVKTIGRLIGGKFGREFSPGRLTQSVRNNPYTVVLFDELEKAHPNILNLLLQVLDEGRLTDASGREIDFTNTIIICTSNAGSEKIREYLKKELRSDELGKIIVDYLLAQGIFRPEFINRFDKVICYKPLTIVQLFTVVKLMLSELNKTIAKKDIKLDITPEAIKEIVREGYDPAFGARPMRRTIQEKVENLLAKKMLTGEIKKGSVITLTEKDM